MWKSKQKDSWEARGQAYVIQVTKSNGKKTSKDTKNSLGKQTDWVTTFPFFDHHHHHIHTLVWVPGMLMVFVTFLQRLLKKVTV